MRTNKNKYSIIYITYGLPASGKTFEAKKLSKYNNDKIVNVDDLLIAYNSKPLSKILELEARNFNEQTVIIDGLFTTNESLITLLNSIYNTTKNYTIHILAFKEDRKACLWNNRNRNKDAAISIKMLPYETVDLEKIKNQTRFKDIIITELNVTKKSIISSLSENLSSNDKDCIESDYWILNGITRDCWGEERKLDREEPVDFIEFRDILKELVGEYSEDFYERSFSYCVSEIKDNITYDYYGGWADIAKWYCDLIMLEEFLKEEGLLKSLERKLKIEEFLED